MDIQNGLHLHESVTLPFCAVISPAGNRQHFTDKATNLAQECLKS